MTTTNRARVGWLITVGSLLIAPSLAAAQERTYRSEAEFLAAAGGREVLADEFDSYASGTRISILFGGQVVFPTAPSVFYGAWGPGPFSGGGLLPQPSFRGAPLVLELDPPVFGVGAYTYDDRDGTPFVNVITLSITTTAGTTVSIAEDVPTVNNTGFLGATSTRGIVRAVFSIDNTNGNLEIDHLRVIRGPGHAVDFDADGAVDSEDFFDFLVAFFASDPAADVNRDGAVDSQDFYDFLTALFAFP